MNVLPFPRPPHYLAAPLPLTFGWPHPQTARVIPGKYGPRAPAGCLEGVPHRRLGQGRGKRRALLAKSELPCGATHWHGA